MQDWEFLIQREGERVWRPLPSDGKAIATGRYRIVAKTTFKNAIAEIRVLYTPPTASQLRETPSSDSQQCDRCVRQTEEDGSLLVLSPTELLPGRWELSCAAPVTVERPEPTRRATVCLHVDGETAIASPDADAPTDDLAPLPERSALPTRSPRLHLTLAREALTVKSGEPLAISGEIARIDGSTEESAIRGLHLRIRLREPQSLRVVATVQRLLSSQTLPLSFSCEMEIPETCTSRLILGEVLLCDAVPNVLSKQSFTVTARLDALLEAIAGGQLDRSILQRSAIAPEPYRSPKRASAPPPPPLDAKTAEALPPQLSDTASKSAKGIDLPSFGNAPPSQESSDRHAPAKSSMEAANNPFGTFDSEPTAEPTAADVPEPSSAPSPNPSPPQLSPVDRAFQALDLPNRFASRLNDLARDDELSAWLASRSDRRSNPFDFGDETAELSQWEAQEVVVDDDFGLALPEVDRSEDSGEAVLEAPLLPTPELEIPSGDLTVGRPVVVRVRLPEPSAGMVVKLWIRDLQNQTLIDGPRWLTDFFLLGNGQQESSVQLSIPRGGLDVQFEAIAVDVDTERESYKATVSRRVLPSGSPTLPLGQGDA
ncbi:hypothetical protein CKA32_006033 [Geitlerinema sp. FC II]|nr:hypothetical protein [Geitlerinema sp. CS-897]PPT07321.1 hypothetical protein CKA32_006033 [Geitlerinema sp. FC II]